MPLFTERDTKLTTTLIGFIDLNSTESARNYVWESWMRYALDLTFASNSSVAQWIAYSIGIIMCNVNFDIGTQCQFYFKFSFQTKIVLQCHRKYNFMKDRWNGCKFTIVQYLYFVSVIPIYELILYFICFIKKKQKATLWQEQPERTVTELCDE